MSAHIDIIPFLDFDHLEIYLGRNGSILFLNGDPTSIVARGPKLV